ncbi:MAG: formate dehydrogenase accessory sulfurtransferase FdhD [Spirochaetales bacterium]|jgi:FdhD protein
MPVSAFPLAPESPVALFVDGVQLAVLMCTPYDIDELAIGHLFSRGIIASRGDLSALSICPDMRSVKITTMAGAGRSAVPEGLIQSACGAADPGASGVAAAPPAAISDALLPPIALEQLTAWAKDMFAAAELYRKTGGLHVAALACRAKADQAGYFVVREDVGRHNAVDKVLGRGFLDQIDLFRSVILTSGRIAADMIHKATAVGVPILVTRSIPTTEAYRIAIESGITLVGRIGSAAPIVYTRPDRIATPAIK